MKRRNFLRTAGRWLTAGAVSWLAPARAADSAWQPAALPDGARASGVLDALPGKVPMLKRSFRPPNYETPLEYFRTVLTPNDAFFVRWHHANVPAPDVREWRLRIRGDAAAQPFDIDLARLRKEFELVSVTAVCLCAGNRRGLFQPHVPGVQWGVGAMGNAVWKGVRLRDLLARAGCRPGAVEVAFDGGDSGVLPTTPDFIKSLPLAKALDENTLVALEMNGEPLPALHGFPARLVVPGWAATYWLKQLTDIRVLSQPQGGFWMNPAYRLPAGLFPDAAPFPSQATSANAPVTDLMVNSLIVTPTNGLRVPRGTAVQVTGLAWDGGQGIREVMVSTDGGNAWVQTSLGEDHGRFSFREFRHSFIPAVAGRWSILVRATNARGDTQPVTLVHNPAGYHHNVMQSVDVEVA